MEKVVSNIKEKYKRVKPYTYLINFLVFISKVILFIITHSLSFAISSFYNLGIGLAKKKIYTKKDNYFSVGFFVIIASLCFIVYSIEIIIFHKITDYNLYTGLMIATVTFYDIGYSIYGIIRSIKKANKQNHLLMLINLATGLISLQLTQSALLSFTNIGVDNSLYNGLIGIIVGTIALIVGLIICKKVD